MMKIFKYLLIIIALMINLNSFAYDIEIDGIYYNINVSKKTASVTWGGKDVYSGTPSYVGDFKIPSSIKYANQEIPVSSIGFRAFYNCNNLISVDIPNSVTSIGDGAFGNCENLTSVEIPNSVISIGSVAFYGCI